MEFNMPIIYKYMESLIDEKILQLNAYFNFSGLFTLYDFLMFKKRCLKITDVKKSKKYCDVKIWYVIDSVPPDDEILNFLDQNILADFRHCS